MRLPEHAPDAPHLLVVDDEPVIRELLASALRRAGYRVTARADGAEALEDLRREEAAVLLTDLRMPRMPGLELIRHARRLRPRIACVVLTGYASAESAIEALRGGADDYLTKPFGVEEVRRVVERVLEGRRLLALEGEETAAARQETEELRRRSREAEAALHSAREDLRCSRQDLERRVLDLEFVAQFTRHIARDTDLERVVHFTARILSHRFGARLARVVVDVADGVFAAEHRSDDDAALRRLVPELLARARRRPDGTLRDLIVGAREPLEGLVAALDVTGAAAGGLALLRPVPPVEAPGDLFLLGLVAHALQVAVEADLGRRAAERNAVSVAVALLDALESRGALFRGHGIRVARLAGAMGRHLGLSPRSLAVLETAARLHDVGAAAVPETVLRREGPLSESERDLVRSQPAVGARILATFAEVAALVRRHRERPDGEGYPDGLSGADVPLAAGVIGVAEAFDAMTHARPFRPSRSRPEALEEIRRLRGRQFVPEAVDALLGTAAETP